MKGALRDARHRQPKLSIESYVCNLEMAVNIKDLCGCLVIDSQVPNKKCLTICTFTCLV